jgi:hypothetical protein
MVLQQRNCSGLVFLCRGLGSTLALFVLIVPLRMHHVCFLPNMRLPAGADSVLSVRRDLFIQSVLQCDEFSGFHGLGGLEVQGIGRGEGMVLIKKSLGRRTSDSRGRN